MHFDYLYCFELLYISLFIIIDIITVKITTSFRPFTSERHLNTFFYLLLFDNLHVFFWYINNPNYLSLQGSTTVLTDPVRSIKDQVKGTTRDRTRLGSISKTIRIPSL